MTALRTFTRREIDLGNPRANEIHLHDVMAGLAGINRFVGHTHRHHTVLAHSVMVYQYVHNVLQERDPRVLRAALMHDAPEAFLGDVSKPLKELLPEYRALEDAWWAHLCDLWDMPHAMPHAVKYADQWACNVELALLWDGNPYTLAAACAGDPCLEPLLWGNALAAATFRALALDLGVPVAAKHAPPCPAKGAPRVARGEG